MQLTEEQEAEVRAHMGKIYGRGLVHLGNLEQVLGQLITERDRYRDNFARALGVPPGEASREIGRLQAIARERYLEREIGNG